MEKIKVGVIGVGMMGSSQIRNCFDVVEGFEVTAICDVYEPNIEKIMGYFAAQNRTVALYRDYREMLEQGDFTLAVIVTPDHLHEEMTVACLNAGKHVRLEKPMATTLEGCRRIAIAQQQSGMVLQIGLELRYSNIIRKMRRSMGSLGNIKMVWCHEFRNPFLHKEGLIPDWITMKQYSGGTLLEKNCHHFDLFNMVLGCKPTKVYASGDNQVEYPHTDVLDNAFVTVDYENGCRAMLSLCMFAPNLTTQKHMHQFELGLLGDRGRLEIRGDHLYLWDREGKSEEHYEYLRSNFEAHNEDINPSLVELADCIRTGKQPYTDLSTGLNSALVSLAAERSAELGRPVDISEMEQEFGVCFRQ